MKRGIAVALLAALAGFGGFFLYDYLAQRAPQPAPDVRLPRLEGGELRLADLRGKLVLVNFWATWCAPCMAEIPLLVEMQQRYAARGLQILGPALDDPQQVRQMLPRLRIQYPVLIGEDAVSSAMTQLGERLGALPYSVLIAPDGGILLRKHGDFQRQELIELLEKHLPRS